MSQHKQETTEMFKGFSKSSGFNGFPSLGFQARSRSRMSLYSKDKAIFWLDASANLPQGIVNNDLIPFWIDRIYGLRFSISLTTLQPRWIQSDPQFNGLPVVHFDHHNKGLISDNNLGPSFGTGQTVALVYQGLTINGSGSPYPIAPIFADIRFTSSRNFYYGYCWRSNTRAQAGYHNGTDPAPAKTASAIGNTNVTIAVISRSGFVGNGSILTPDFNNITIAGILNSLGGCNQYGPGGIIKIAEIIVFDQDYDNSACLDICNELNAKYGIY